MSQRILVVGATGRLGRNVVDALIEFGHSAACLVRNETGGGNPNRKLLLEGFRRNGVTIIDGGLEDEAGLERACAGADVVISCVDHQPDHLQLQANLARAASRSGSVRRILPSQFGVDSRLYGDARVDHGDVKRRLQKIFTECGVPATFVHCNGLASEWVGSLGQLGLPCPPAQEVEVYGGGKTKFSMTATEDVARYAVRTLTDEQTLNRHVVIAPSDNILTQRELIDLWEKKADVTLRRRSVSAEALDNRIAALAQDAGMRAQFAMAQLVRAAWIDGLGDGRRLPDTAELSTLYPEIRYMRSNAYLDRYLP